MMRQNIGKNVSFSGSIFENPALTTDVIVGFPQESEEEFEASGLCRQHQFYETHIFKYSKRQGTKAAKMDRQIPEHEKTRRSNIMLELNRKKCSAMKKDGLEKKVEVLFEEMTERDGKNYVTGHTKEYLRIGVPCEPEQADRWTNQLKRDRTYFTFTNYALNFCIDYIKMNIVLRS